ncbi:MAG: glutathione S-transferase family protein [Rhodospirillaceae bacterium]|nr:glutathione S-transferase family protein [Rhodospirillaceae bacterium]
MATLYHHTLCPLSRKVRLVLHEKRLRFDELVQDPNTAQDDFLAINPSGDVPVFVDDDGTTVSDAANICEYLDEVYTEPRLIGRTPQERAEARRLAAWFDQKFYREVTLTLAGEKLFKRAITGEAPDSRALKAGRANIRTHLEYIAWLCDRRNWLAGERIGIADLSAAAHLSLVDYTGDVPWDEHPLAKEWYVRIKSRLSFRCLLGDVVAKVPPAPAYVDLDF